MREDRYEGLHWDAFSDQQYLLRQNEVKTIFDLGANTGQTAEKYRSHFPGATVYSFEPTAKTFATLETKFSGQSRVRPFNLAVSDQAGKVTLHHATRDYSNSLFPFTERGAAIVGDRRMESSAEVEATTLDEFCRAHAIAEIDILKMDIQGSELRALRGARELLTGRRVKLIYTEVLFSEIYEGQGHFEEQKRLLSDLGYRLFALYDFNYTKDGYLSWADAIFTP